MSLNNQSIFSPDIQEPDSLMEWREHTGSLTDKLYDARGSTDLEVIAQNWSNRDWWEHYFLKIKSNRVFLREIVMKNAGVEYWYARTIIPQSCYDLNTEFFKRLEHESIRNLIFGEESVKRLNRVCYPVNSENIEYHWVKNHIKSVSGILWVRLAEYAVHNKESFFLIEILLPELETVL
ncbi:chorismate lyase [uncultured Legionella sp.]|uniref:chorismate--pyruvate lyase family protein n=1 Tax=uncultured Legionella sp. TaxID=210934 RepID=UPI002620A908|nr:chorismate lyase [uncultured Legionella sp.]